MDVRIVKWLITTSYLVLSAILAIRCFKYIVANMDVRELWCVCYRSMPSLTIAWAVVGGLFILVVIIPRIWLMRA